MLSPDYIKSAPAFIVQQFSLLEDEVIREVSERVGKTGKLSTTSLYQLNLMHDISESTEQVNKIIDDGFKAIGKTTEELIADSASFTYADDIEKFQAYSSNILPSFKNNAFIQNITDGIKMQTTEELAKLSKTKGFLIGGKFIQADDLLGNLTSQAIFQTSSGLFTYEDISRRLIKQLGDSGIRTIDYESGRSYEMESQIRRIVVDGVRQLSNNIGLRNANDLGTDLMEVSAHSRARPTHADWQGQIVSLSGKGNYLTTDDIGYGYVDGFGGANCRHSWYPYFEGSTRMHTPEELEDYANEMVMLDGKEVSSYDASQVLRRYERSIRTSQRRLEGFKSLGDSQAYEQERTRLRRLRAAYGDTTAQTGIKGDPRFLKIYKSDGKTSKLNYIPKPSTKPTPIPNAEFKSVGLARERNKIFKSASQKWEQGLSYLESEALVEYTDDGYKFINKFLRTGDLPIYMPERTTNYVTQISKALDRFELKENITTYRMSTIRDFTGGAESVGEVFEFKSFVSTTTTKGKFKISKNPAEIVHFTIDVPAGSKGAWLGNISAYKKENEFLLQKNTRTVIKEVTKNRNGSTNVLLEVIGVGG